MPTPSSTERSPRLAHLAVIAEVVSTLAVALWLGGMLALGAFAAPEVFAQLSREVAGSVMGAIFAKFDRMVLALVGVLLVSEGVRAFVEGVRGKLQLARLGTMLVLVGLALTSALWLGPSINELFEQGVRRGVGDAGMRMDRLHDMATTLGKVAFVFATAWLALGVVIHRQARRQPRADVASEDAQQQGAQL